MLVKLFVGDLVPPLTSELDSDLPPLTDSDREEVREEAIVDEASEGNDPAEDEEEMLVSEM